MISGEVVRRIHKERTDLSRNSGWAAALARAGRAEYRSDLREYLADGIRNWGKCSTAGNGNKTSHQGVFDEVLRNGIAPDPEPVSYVRQRIHWLFPPVTDSGYVAQCPASHSYRLTAGIFLVNRPWCGSK